MSELPPRAEVVDALKFAVAPAALAAAGVYTLTAAMAFRLWADWRRLTPAAGVLALAAAVVAGTYFRAAFPWPPGAAWWHWAGPAVAVAALAELVARTRGVSGEAGHLLRGLAAGAVAGAVTPPEWQEEARWTFPLVAAVLAAEWGVLVAVGRRAGGGTTALAVSAVAGGAAALLLHHHVLGFADVATFVHVALAVVAGLAWLTRSDGSGAAAAAAAPVVAALVLGRFLSESEVPRNCFLAVGLAPLALAGLLLPGVRRLAGRPAGVLLAVLVVGLPVGWAVKTASDVAPLRFDAAEKWDG